MRLVNDHVRVTVPATSANLGPGYDCLGICLGLRDTVDLWATTGRTRVEVSGCGAGEVPTGSDNLVAAAAHHTLDVLGAPQVGLHLRCVNRIPHGAGLGSSAAAIVAGIELARGLAGTEALSDDDVLQLATQMEGHPDNVAPAIYGGATVAWISSSGPATVEASGELASASPRRAQLAVGDEQFGRAQVVRISPPNTLACTVLIPKFRVSTKRARQALPLEVPHEDGAFNVARASLLTLVLAGLAPTSHLLDATADALHQDYRRAVMPATMALIDLLREEGLPAVISGAGPSVLVLAELPEHLVTPAREAGWRVESLALESTGAQWRASRLT